MGMQSNQLCLDDCVHVSVSLSVSPSQGSTVYMMQWDWSTEDDLITERDYLNSTHISKLDSPPFNFF